MKSEIQLNLEFVPGDLPLARVVYEDKVIPKVEVVLGDEVAGAGHPPGEDVPAEGLQLGGLPEVAPLPRLAPHPHQVLPRLNVDVDLDVRLTT